MDLKKIAPLFEGWEETMVWSCLQGCMGYAIVDHEETPRAAQLVVGDFCFFAGEPQDEWIRQPGAPILVPRDAVWAQRMEAVLGYAAEKRLRYAICKEPDRLNRKTLQRFAQSLQPPFSLRRFDRDLYEQAMAESWSRDFCSLFRDFADFQCRGLGVGVVLDGKLVAGASSYSVYCGGIEIQIETHSAYRRKGLATACGAALILDCLDQGRYPSWDAHDLRSVALAEKLGYRRGDPYWVYVLRDDPKI